MQLDHARLLDLPFVDHIQTYDAHAAMLYALSIGLGGDPLDAGQLRYVYEDNLRVFPSMAHVLAMETDWMFDPRNGIDLARLLHIESGMTLLHSLPPGGSVRSRMAITDIFDRGEGKGALLRFQRDLRDADSNETLAVVTGTFLLRGNGGFGGRSGRFEVPAVIPERDADTACDLATLPQSALLYRLNNDLNPLHADPETAQRAGFERPILHGACTYAIACHAFIRTVPGYDGPSLRHFDTRFSAPVLPGDTIRTEFWHLEGGRFAFRARALERDVIVLDNGLAEHY